MTSLHSAALAYAEAGWFVIPTSPTDVKNPGSVVGGAWNKRSSRDPAQIDEWWAANPNYGIALHVGRSGAVGFDLDTENLNELPLEMRDALRAAAVQSTRPGSDRGHYVFTVNRGESFSNSAGTFASFGEVRGRNGVLIAEPTPHPSAESADAEYQWVTLGSVPPLPDALRQCLNTTTESEVPPFSSAELDAFLDAHVSSDRPAALDGVLKVFERNVERGMARHEALVRALPMALREAAAGCYPARKAYDRLDAAFEAAFTTPRYEEGALNRGRYRPGPNEFRRTANWAAAQASQADPAETLARLNRGDGAVIDEEAFWASRPLLVDLRAYAHAKLVSPWAMLGAVLARAITAIPPRVVLPPTVGSVASLNCFFALVGPSGLGKGTAESAAEDFLDTFDDVFTAPAGSGEGLVKLYAVRTKASEPQKNLREAVLMSVDEVDGFTAQATRTGGTFLSTLKSAWSGASLGFSYADATKAVVVKKHRYRLALVMGVQPERAEFLFADGDGGTPQRFVWLPTGDETVPDDDHDAPPPFALTPWPARTTLTGSRLVEVGGPSLEVSIAQADLDVLPIPETVIQEIRERRRQALRNGGDGGLDGHAVLARLKVAAGLMWLDSRFDKVSEADWELAGIVMAVSDRTRADVQRALKAKAKSMNQRRGEAEAERSVMKSEAVEDSAIKRVATNIRKQLAQENDQSRSKLRRKIAKRDHEFFDDAEERLIAVGDVTKSEHTYRGQVGHKLHLRQR